MRRAGPVRGGRSCGAAQGKFRKALYSQGNGGDAFEGAEGSVRWTQRE